VRSSMLMPVETGPHRKRLTEDVQQTLLGWIGNGKFPPGSQLPSEPELVKKLEVSRTVIRQALQGLGGMNLVGIRPRVGWLVESVPSDLVVNADVMASLRGMEAIVEVGGARKVIEAGVARLAALTATEEDFEEMEEILRKIKRAAQ